jgi:hypothetical protein
VFPDCAQSGSSGAETLAARRRPSIRFAVVGMNIFEMREHDVSVEAMAVRRSCVGNHRVCDLILVVAAEHRAASGTLLLVGHDLHSKARDVRPFSDLLLARLLGEASPDRSEL